MKLVINDYLVKIDVKDLVTGNNGDIETMNFLNKISMWASDSSLRNKENGLNEYAKEAEKTSDDIYFYLREQGFYKPF